MKIEVKLFAYFRDNRFSKKEIEVKSGTTVREIIADLAIDPEEVGVTMINGRHCSMDTTPAAHDSLGVFPMIGGG